MLLLPLKSDLGDTSRALGCLVSDGKIGRTPRRFDASRIDIVDLADRIFSSPEIDTAARNTASTPQVPTPGFAEPEAEFQLNRPAPRTHSEVARTESERPYLRLVRGDKPTN